MSFKEARNTREIIEAEYPEFPETILHAELCRACARVSVPDDVMAAMQKVARIRLDLNDFDGDRRGIADCLVGAEEALIEVVNHRAAMLQAGNSPAAPDGWIPVSERMPDKLIPVIVMYADGEMWSAMWNGNRWDDGTEYPDPHSVTHWREMPAAPQQEVKK